MPLSKAYLLHRIGATSKGAGHDTIANGTRHPCLCAKHLSALNSSSLRGFFRVFLSDNQMVTATHVVMRN
jgi:hypothetical protein